MSGPKVVRVVTREERVATCTALLARLEAALQEWERVTRRSGNVTAADIQAMRARSDELKRALAADRFDQIERTAPAETQFVQREQERRQTEAVNREALKRRVRSRTRRIEAEMRAAPRTAQQTGSTDAQRALAKRLKEDADEPSLEQWLAEHPSPADAETAKIERQLAELSFLLDAAAVAALEAKLEAAEREMADTQRRAMLLDSLTLELAALVKQAREQEALKARLRALAEELRSTGSATAIERAASVLTAIDNDAAALSVLETETVKALAAERDSLSAQARRNAVLQGLATLGYQVNEGLETAWVQSGRVVVKRPTQPGYGVELGGKTENGRLQVRVVAFRGAGDVADSSRDKDAERMWCSDFSKLQEQIAAAGGGLVIERALAVGETPVKAVEDIDANAAAADRVAPARERSLRT